MEAFEGNYSMFGSNNDCWLHCVYLIFRIVNMLNVFHNPFSWGAQWVSGRVLDSRPKGRGFEPHRRHCVVVLEQDTFILA